MLGISGLELVIIVAVVMIVVKPEDLPSLIRTMRQVMAKCRRLYDEIMGQIDGLGGGKR